MSFFGKTYSFYSLSGAFRPEAFAVISAKSLLISILLVDYEPLSTFVS